MAQREGHLTRREPPARSPLDDAPPGRIRLPKPGALALRIALGLAVAIVLVVVFAQLVNLQGALRRLEHLRLAPALLCGAVFLGAYVVRALRWRLFLAPRRVSGLRAVAIYQVATFVNWLLPVRGGELVKSLLLRRLDAIPVSESLPTVAMDKTMDLLPAVALFALLPFLPIQLSQPLWALLTTVLIALAVGALFLGLAAWRRQTALAALGWCARRLPRTWRAKVEPFVLRFVDALLALARRPRLLLAAAALTAVAVALDALNCWLAFAATNTSLAFPLVLFGYTLYNLGFILPTPPGQIGSNELIGLLIFAGLFHVNTQAVAAMFLFAHPFTAILLVATGLISLSAMGISLRATFTLARRGPGPDPALATDASNGMHVLDAEPLEV